MSRRRLVTLISAFVLLGLGLVAAIAIVSVTRTTYGRDQVRRAIVAGLGSKVRGTLYLGEITGGLLTGVTIDSLEIRDPDDSLFVATGPIHLDYDPRDLIDKRILLSRFHVERPVVHLKKYENGDWNWKRVFPRGKRGPPSPERDYGDFIVATGVRVSDGSLILTQPWRPADSLSGARRDSAVKANLRRTDAEIRRAKDGFARTRRWTSLQLRSDYVRLADPDSVGRYFAIDDLSVVENDPPFEFRNVRGGIRTHHDSLWLDLPHLELPASTGSGKGKVVWGSELPIRYDIRVIGDSVAMRDIAWIYPTLPTTGGGSMKLHIRNDPRNLDVIDYALRDLDVRSHRSRLRGRMTFGVGGPVLVVKNVDLTAAPVNFDLLRQLNGEPFTVDWQGDLTGRVRGPGGPVNRFIVSDANIGFEDAHVPGATARFTGEGELDILDPGFTTFRGFDVAVAHLDLRTIQRLFPEFPRLGGSVAGRATLDSVWLDVRFRDASLAHVDGPGEPTRLAGSGRVTLGDLFTTYDLDLEARPLSLTTLARSYPLLRTRGAYAGPVRVNGTLEDLDVAGTLSGPAGTIEVDGTFDVYGPTYGARGLVATRDLDVRTLLDRPGLPETRLTARFEPQLRGDSLPTLTGALAVDVARSDVDGIRVYPSRARLRFGDGRVRVDTLFVETVIGHLSATGGLGLAPGVSDSLRYNFTADSLGGLRRLFERDESPIRLASSADGGAEPFARRTAEPDSLAGTLTTRGVVTGSVQAPGISGSVEGQGLLIGKSRASRLAGTYSATGLAGAPRGTMALTLDTLSLMGVRLRRAGLLAQQLRPGQLTFSATAASDNGPQALVGGLLDRSGDSTVLTLQDVSLLVRPGQAAAQPRIWRLRQPTRIVRGPAGVTIDTLELVRSSGGRIIAAGRLPDSASVDLIVRGDGIPLADFGVLLQRQDTVAGRLRFDAHVAGSRQQPRFEANGELLEARFGAVQLERVSARASYSDRRLRTTLDLFRDERVVLAGQLALPIDLALVPVAERRPDEPLTGRIQGDSVDLGVVETLSPSLDRATGRLDVDVALAGTWRQPRMEGRLAVANGDVGLPNLGSVRLQQLNGLLLLSGDSVRVERLSARSGPERGDTASVSGSVRFASLDNPLLDVRLTTRTFTLLDKPRVGRLVVNSALALTGPLDQAFLSGDVTIVEGEIRIPELFTKEVVRLDISDPDFYQVVDTTVFRNRSLVPPTASTFAENLDARVRLTLGQDVWLRSEEANIQLAGDLAIRRTETGIGGEPQLALSGALNASRGTYRLNLNVVQRTFDVDRGQIRFDGGDLNPTLDISAVHTVRQPSTANRPDVRIRVDIGGTLNSPTLGLRSDEGLPISESDLVSYLVTGSPGFGLANTEDVDGTSTVASVLLPSAGSVLANKVPAGLVDVLEVQTAGVDEAQLRSSGLAGSILNSTRLNLGWQIGNRTFVSANFGLCGFGGTLTGGNVDTDIWRDSFGARVEHQFNHGVSLEMSAEPTTTALMCSTSGATRGYAPTDRQFGFDLFKTWQF